jgi:two-component system sensor histidine kinase/response regulator
MSSVDNITKQDKQDNLRVQSFIFLSYFATGVLIHNYLTLNGAVSVVGAGSGLALAALLIGGKRYLWMILICSLLLNAALYQSPYLAGGIALTNVLEAWVAYFLVTHYSQSFTNLSSLPAYLRLIFFGGAAPAVVGAFFAVAILLVTDFSPQTNFLDDTIHWWMGDTLGVAIFTPLILAWWQTRSKHFFEKHLLEPLLLFSISLLVGQIVFLNLFSEYFSDTPKGYWMFLVVTVVALRTGIRGTTFVVTVLAFQALFGAYNEMGVFAHDIARAGLSNYWASMLILSIVGISITTHITALDEAKEQILSLAFYDALTQLPNRRLLNDRIWTPPRLQAIRFLAGRFDCSRISGL